MNKDQPSKENMLFYVEMELKKRMVELLAPGSLTIHLNDIEYSVSIYSQPSLSRLRLSRITAYLEEKI